MLNKIKNRYCFLFIELLTLIFLRCLIISLIKHDDAELSATIFLFNISILGLLTIALIIYIFELFFPNFRIPQKIVNHILYKIWFYGLLPFTAMLLLLALMPLVSLIYGLAKIIFGF